MSKKLSKEEKKDLLKRTSDKDTIIFTAVAFRDILDEIEFLEDEIIRLKHIILQMESKK